MSDDKPKFWTASATPPKPKPEPAPAPEIKPDESAQERQRLIEIARQRYDEILPQKQSQWTADASGLRKTSGTISSILVILNAVSAVIGFFLLVNDKPIGLVMLIVGVLGCLSAMLFGSVCACLAALVEQGNRK